MDVLRMKVLLERYRQLKIRIENSRHRICRIKASSFEQYIEEKTYHSPLGERRLQGGKPSHPTETLGMYGRMQFERERDAQLRAEECRLREMQALLWQIDSLITAYNSAYTHKVTWKFGSYTATQSIAAGTAYASYTIPLSWLAAIPNATSGAATVIPPLLLSQVARQSSSVAEILPWTQATT